MTENIFSLDDIKNIIRPLCVKYNIERVYLFGSYARGEASPGSDLDFIVYGGDNFKPVMVFSFAEELRQLLNKNADVFEINEIDDNSEFYNRVMKEKILVS